MKNVETKIVRHSVILVLFLLLTAVLTGCSAKYVAPTDANTAKVQLITHGKHYGATFDGVDGYAVDSERQVVVALGPHVYKIEICAVGTCAYSYKDLTITKPGQYNLHLDIAFSDVHGRSGDFPKQWRLEKVDEIKSYKITE